jgi:putative transposase
MSKRKSDFIINETLVKIGSAYIWIRVAIKLKSREIPALNISKERNMLIVELLVSSLVKIYGKYPVITDGGTLYPMTCRFLNLDHHINSSLEKSLIERTMQYTKDRTEYYDDYSLCRLFSLQNKELYVKARTKLVESI